MLREVFDFIIVGAGTAGCLLADRLTINGKYSVLLIEAGQATWNPLTRVPMGVGAIWNHPRYNWQYQSEPEQALNSRRLFLPRGKVVGGSSIINAMNYVRGNPADFDAWSKLHLPRWSSAETLPYFKRLENYLGADPDGLRGKDGPLTVTEAQHADPIVDALFSTLSDLGYEALTDYNGAIQEGFGRAQFNISKGARQSAKSSFLDPARKRQNLVLKANSLVDRIDFSEDRRAVGVLYRFHDQTRNAVARREVILAAGAFSSPVILMRSGIGRADELREHNVQPITDLPAVGQNLWEHPRVTIEYRRRKPSYIAKTLPYHRLVLALARCLVSGTGNAALPLAAAHLFTRSAPDVDSADIQYLFRLFNPALAPIYPWQRHNVPDTFGLVTCLVQPNSRGSIRLRDTSPLEPPEIRTGILSDERDIVALIRAAKEARRIASHPAIQQFVDTEVVPKLDCDDDRDWRSFIRDTADTIFHPAGTCAMDGLGRGVVDAELRVQSVRGLSVADASVMPLPVTGNIQAAVLMVAEKASEFILQRALRSP